MAGLFAFIRNYFIILFYSGKKGDENVVHRIEEVTDGAMYDSQIFSEYFSGMKIAVADIETTGLSPEKAAVILGGAVLAEGGKRKVIQFFADSVKDEPELLRLYSQLLSDCQVVITFNGHRFDLPFLKKRMTVHGLDTAPLDRLYSMDIYRILRYHSHLPKILPNLKQKTVEKFLGDAGERKDEIDGAQSVELYYEYVKTGRLNLREKILLHNRDDIVRLSGMLRILRTLDLHEIMYSEGFPAFSGEPDVHVSEIRLKGAVLRCRGMVYGTHTSYRCFDEGYEFELPGDSGEFLLNIFCEKIADSVVLDTVSAGADFPSLREMGGYESGFLILKQGEKINHREINAAVRSILNKLLQ